MFRNTPKIIRRLPKIAEGHPKISEDLLSLYDDFRRLPKMTENHPNTTEDYRGLPKKNRRFWNAFRRIANIFGNLQNIFFSPALRILQIFGNFFSCILLSNHTVFLFQYKINLHS